MLLTAVPIGGTRGFIRGAARNPSPIKTVEISVRSPRTRLLTRHRADSGRDTMKETVIRVEDQPLPRPVDDGSLEWAPGVGVGLPDRVRDASVSVSAALIATAVRNGAAGAMVATTRILLAFNALAFSRQVVVAMVNRGSAAEAGQLCCVAVEGGNSDIVVRLSIELLVSGFTREAAAVAAAFYAAARMRWASADPVAQLLSQAIVAAVRAEHAEQVADVTDQLVEGSQNELVLDIMRAMVAEGHGQEAGEISVAALKLGKADVLSQITHELGGAGEVGVLTSVGVNAAVAGAKAAADSLMEATTHLAGCQPCAGGACAAEPALKALPPAPTSDREAEWMNADAAAVPLSHPPL
ncbi:hypothetical protein ACKKBG_A16940 [Auxenochlorella protothecoides x Auxenochlorella symbiontica]